jgi:hypothetical protein
MQIINIIKYLFIMELPQKALIAITSGSLLSKKVALSEGRLKVLHSFPLFIVTQTGTGHCPGF